MASAASVVAERPPTTNRGVYPHSGWSDSAIDYCRATVCASVELVLARLVDGLAKSGRTVTPEPGAAVRHYAEHRGLTDRLGRVVVDIFWGGQNIRPNVEVKGSNSPLVVPILRTFEHRPSRIDVKRDGGGDGLFASLVERGLAFADERGIARQHITHHDPDKGDTLYLGSRKSTAFLRIYQPGLKLAQAEGRTGDDITADERQAVRVEQQFNSQKQPAKHAAATLSPDELWGVSPWIAEFASEVFAMNVQPISVSDRRESDRNRALRFMAKQYSVHLADLFRECEGDPGMFGAMILDLADIPHTH